MVVFIEVDFFDNSLTLNLGSIILFHKADNFVFELRLTFQQKVRILFQITSEPSAGLVHKNQHQSLPLSVIFVLDQHALEIREKSDSLEILGWICLENFGFGGCVEFQVAFEYGFFW